MSRIRPILFLTLAAAMMVSAACGSSSSSGSSSGGGASSPPPTSSTPSSSSGGAVGSGGSGFCGQGKADVNDLQSKLSGIAGAAGTAGGLKTEMQTLLTAYKDAEAEAPAEIKPDLQTIYDFVNTINSTLSAKNYDPTAIVGILPQIQAQQAKLKAAANHIQAWAVANCGA